MEMFKMIRTFRKNNFQKNYSRRTPRLSHIGVYSQKWVILGAVRQHVNVAVGMF